MTVTERQRVQREKEKERQRDRETDREYSDGCYREYSDADCYRTSRVFLSTEPPQGGHHWTFLTLDCCAGGAAELTYADLMRDWEQTETATQLYTEILTLLDSGASDGAPEYAGWSAV